MSKYRKLMLFSIIDAKLFEDTVLELKSSNWSEDKLLRESITLSLVQFFKITTCKSLWSLMTYDSISKGSMLSSELANSFMCAFKFSMMDCSDNTFLRLAKTVAIPWLLT